MTFSYTPSPTPNDVTKIRYWIGDTDEAVAIFSDEEIAMAVGMEGGAQAATISLIQSIIGRLAAEPNITADWLRVDWRGNIGAWEKLLAQRRREFGLGLRLTVRGQSPYRADSFQDTAPDWDAIFRGLDRDNDWDDCL